MRDRNENIIILFNFEINDNQYFGKWRDPSWLIIIQSNTKFWKWLKINWKIDKHVKIKIQFQLILLREKYP